MLVFILSKFSSDQCCFTAAETTRTIRDKEPRSATSTFTQLLIPDFLVEV